MTTQKAKFPLPPGIALSQTPYEAVGRYIDADKVRFFKGMPEKIGGWEQWNEPGDELPNICRSIKCWQDFNYNVWHAFGTSHRLYVFDQNKDRSNITPIVSTGTINNPFTTTAGSTTVEVHDVNHGLVVGQEAIFSDASAVGGITIDGTYSVTAIIDADNYEIEHTSAASASVAGGGGAVTYEYELEPGNVNVTFGSGWGVGRWGLSTWGTPRTDATFTSFPRFWCLDKYGQYLLALPSGGKLYRWELDPTTRAEEITGTGVPTSAQFMFITDERYPVLLGTDGDLMRMQWPDQDDITLWTPADTNSANIRNLQEGSRLMAGARLVQGTSMIWSDTAVYLMQYTGTNFVYRTPCIGKKCGLIGPTAFCVVDGVPFWMSGNEFYTFQGSVQPVPNSADVNAIFENINATQRTKIQCHFNAKFREVWWL